MRFKMRNDSNKHENSVKSINLGEMWRSTRFERGIREKLIFVNLM